MATTEPVKVSALSLDLNNFRTVPQKDEKHAVHALASIETDYFWELMQSLLDNGYLPTENIIVMRDSSNPQKLVVKEGNRRIGALKIILGYLTLDDPEIPNNIQEKIEKLDSTWRADNEEVPCTIYEASEATIVDRIVSRTHGKGEKSGRLKWPSVATARHNRDVNSTSEPGLDLLEKYLDQGKNLTQQQKDRWAGDYPISVLDDAMKRIAKRFGVASAKDLAKRYPNISHRSALEGIVHAIGMNEIGFKDLRREPDFAIKYGLPLVTPSSPPAPTSTQSSTPPSNPPGPQGGSPQPTTPLDRDTTMQPPAGKKKPTALAMDDPRHVISTLKKMKIVGNNRQKVVSLRDEAVKLDITKTPMAFCFLLRSMFEISAKAYCDDHAPKLSATVSTKNGSIDKQLADLLREVYQHMITLPNGKQDRAKERKLHGAMTELGKADSILSVVSLNQLVHNPNFSITERHISIMFSNIFPLLEAMNQ